MLSSISAETRIQDFTAEAEDDSLLSSLPLPLLPYLLILSLLLSLLVIVSLPSFPYPF
jgi:hypothetical protein